MQRDPAQSRVVGAVAHRSARTIVLALALSACGLTYTSPKVEKETEDGTPVTVLPLSSDVVAQANRSAYTPRSLPRAFYADPSGQRRALPAKPRTPDLRPMANVLNPPPVARTPLYRIGIGDVLLLSTQGTAPPVSIEGLGSVAAPPSTSRQGFTVRDDGAIAIPEVGSVTLAGLTLQEAENALFEALVEAQIDPSFSLEVAEFNSQRVSVGGAVTTPVVLPVTLAPLTLSEAMTAAGALLVPDAQFTTIRIYREGTLYQIPLEAYLKDGGLQKTILLNGDAIYVDSTYNLDRAIEFFKQELDVRADALAELQAEIGTFNSRSELDAEARDYVYVTGEVVGQNRFTLPFGRQASLADVLYDGGGFNTETGDADEIYVVRRRKDSPTGEIVAYHLSGGNVANLVLATELQMRPNDIVFIEEQVITKWGRALQQLLPVLAGRVNSELGGN